MSGLTSRQRKMVYGLIIVALMFVVNLIGRPSGKPANAVPGAAAGKEDVGGGTLARLRHQHDLGESNLGQVDPSSATMNLVLVGLRGIAANKLWMDAIENQEQKNWAALENNVKSIILLQPHFVKVWEFQSWNLSYNVSAEWDLLQDKYHWIKEGAKFGIRGTKRNAKNPELYWWVGVILGNKIGTHDAWMYLRKFFNPGAYDAKDPFVGDPFERERNKVIAPDKELNPQDEDNYLVSKKWFLRANDADLTVPQRRMMAIAFRQRPAKAQYAYAEMLQKEGRFGDKATMLQAWRTGLRNWTTVYEEGNRPGLGQEQFQTLNGVVRIGVDTSDSAQLRALTRLDDPPGQFTVEQKRRGITAMRGIVNYNFWKARGELEGLDSTVDARRDIFAGKKELVAANLEEAIRLLEQGLQGFAKLIIEHPELDTNEESIAEDILIGVIAWRDAMNLQGGDTVKSDALPWRNATTSEQRAWFRALDRLEKAKQAQMDEFRRIYRRETYQAKQ